MRKFYENKIKTSEEWITGTHRLYTPFYLWVCAWVENLSKCKMICDNLVKGSFFLSLL